MHTYIHEYTCNVYRVYLLTGTDLSSTLLEPVPGPLQRRYFQVFKTRFSPAGVINEETTDQIKRFSEKSRITSPFVRKHVSGRNKLSWLLRRSSISKSAIHFACPLATSRPLQSEPQIAPSEVQEIDHVINLYPGMLPPLKQWS